MTHALSESGEQGREAGGGVGRVPEECPEEVAKLVARCMKQEPKDRPSAYEIITALREVMGLLPESMSGDLDATVLSSPTTRLKKGRRFISGLQLTGRNFGEGNVGETIQEEELSEGSAEGEEEAARAAFIPEHLLPFVEEDQEGYADDDGNEEVPGQSFATSYEAPPLDTAWAEAPGLGKEAQRVIYRKWRSFGGEV